jgi:hypothetical protein
LQRNILNKIFVVTDNVKCAICQELNVNIYNIIQNVQKSETSLSG